MPFPEGDRRHPVQKSAQRLCRGLRDRIGRSAGDNNGSVAIASAERAFQEANAKDHLRVIVEEVGHTVTPAQRQAALEWFEKWLK